MLVQPCYSKTAIPKFIDPCFWCRFQQCRRSHGLEMVAYRMKLHNQARQQLGLVYHLPAYAPIGKKRGRASTERFVLNHEESIKELLNRPPEEMDIHHHRLKAEFLRFSKTMDRNEAWEAAVEHENNISKRSWNVFPRFTREEWQNLKKYRPKNRLQVNRLY
jgi:hypothetical protein